jgi:hypothetical protein
MEKFYLDSLKNNDAYLMNGWSSVDMAIKRYLFAVPLYNKFSVEECPIIYDYGCGTANFNEYVKHRKYVGIEEIEEMYLKAKEMFPNVEVHHKTLEDMNIGVYGFKSLAIALGIYMVGDNDTREEVIEKTIKHCKLLCDRHYYGYLFNSKHDHVDYKEPHMVYYNLSELIHRLQDEGLKVTCYLFDKYEFFMHVKKF